jgi:hypothetical protein
MGVHVKGSLTQLPEMPPAIELMGAYLPPADLEESYEAIWRTFSIDDASTIDEGLEIIFGDSMDSIEQDLNERYPGPNGTSRVERTGSHQQDQWNSARYHAGEWRVLKQPIVTLCQKTKDAVVKELQDWIITAGGAVYVKPAELPNALSKSFQLREAGFTFRRGIRGLFIINYRPRQAAKTIHRSEDSVYRELMRGYFTYEPMDAIYKKISQHDSWPWQEAGPENRLKDIISIQRHDGYGYGAYTDEEKRRLGEYRTRATVEQKLQDLYNCRYNCMLVARDILDLIKVARRLCRGCREDNRWYDQTFKHGASLKAQIEQLLPHLHGCEDFSRTEPDLARRGNRETIKAFIAEQNKLHASLRSFCNWVRREAKHFKLAIPKRPRPPKLKVVPRKKKSKTRRKGKRTTIRGRTRKRVAENAPA